MPGSCEGAKTWNCCILRCSPTSVPPSYPCVPLSGDGECAKLPIGNPTEVLAVTFGADGSHEHDANRRVASEGREEPEPRGVRKAAVAADAGCPVFAAVGDCGRGVPGSGLVVWIGERGRAGNSSGRAEL